MLIKRTSQPELTWSLYLGLGAFAVNLALHLIEPNFALKLGNALIFFSAIAFGVTGAITSSLIGLGLAAPIHFDPIYLARTALLAITIGFAAKRFPGTPAFFITFVLWYAVLGPVLSLLSFEGLNIASLTPEFLVRDCLNDLILTVLAGVMMLNRSIWAWMTQKPRHTDLTNFLIHITALVSAMMLAIFLSLTYGGAVWNGTVSYPGSASAMFGMLFLAVNLSLFVGWMLGMILSENVHEFFASTLFMESHGASFSGASSDYWRRKSSDAIERPEVRTPPTVHDTESELAAAQEFINANKGLLALNKNGTISFVNRHFRSLCGITQNEVLGKRIDAIGIRDEISSHILELVDATFEKGPQTTELKVNTPPNQLRYFEIVSLQSDAFATLCEGPDSVIITMQDITDRRAVEAHLLKGQRLASLGQIVRGIAHSFNNTLTSITARASYAKYTDDHDELKENLSSILGAAQDAGNLVRQLIDFADGKPTLLEKMDLTGLLQDRMDLLEKLGGESIEIKLEETDEIIGIKCDPNQIMQAVTNLVINSIDAYGNTAGNINISLGTETIDEEASELHVGTRPGRFARLRVRDTAIGMHPETLGRAFDPLFTTKADCGNAGLGLSIVYAIVRAHDGFLTVESRLQKGTTISVYIPLVELDAKRSIEMNGHINEIEQAAEKKKNKKEHILIVEDENHVRELISELLSQMGYIVTSCSDGEEALGHFLEKDFDLVLIDMIMPRMDGLELLGKLKEHDSSVKTLAMSGYGLDADAIKKFSNVIPKPFDIDSLVQAIKKTISKEQVERKEQKDEEHA